MPDLEELRELLNSAKPIGKNLPEAEKMISDIDNYIPGCYDKSRKIFITEEKYPLGINFGQREIQNHFLPDVIKKYACLRAKTLENMLFIDTETTGLTGGTGTYAFLIGIGFIREDDIIIRQYFLTRLSGEAELVYLIRKEMSEYDGVVSFNGKSYDIPLLRNRFVLNGVNYDFSELEHLDLLHLSRRFWKKELFDCSLNNLERKILGFVRDSDLDIPGEQIPHVYGDYLKTHNARMISRVFYHNRNDILAMFALIDKIAEVIEKHGKNETFGLEHIVVSRLYEDVKQFKQAIRGYRSYLETNDDNVYNKRLSMLYKKMGKISKCIKIWKTAAENHQIYAMEELAKIEEHRNHDFSKALQWTEKALELLKNATYVDPKRLERFKHRSDRLNKKLKE